MGACRSKALSENGSALDIVKFRGNHVNLSSISERAVKILLLGTGGSGKTTIMKQMRFIHGEHIADYERRLKIQPIHLNVFKCISQLFDGIQKLELEVSQSTQENFDLVASYKEVFFANGFPPELTEAIEKIWIDPVIVKAYDRRCQYLLDDSAAYFLDEIERIGATDYLPSDDDILRLREETRGIQEFQYSYRNTTFSVYDVPGQRSQRHKWIQCFDGVHAVLFVVAISEYDRMCEDHIKNSVQDTVDLFGRCINSVYLKESHPIVFLNKIDLFREKVAQVPINKFFEEYKGPRNNAECGLAFFQKQFEAKCKGYERRRMFVHKSCATDTAQFQPILESAADAVMAKAFAAVGLF